MIRVKCESSMELPTRVAKTDQRVNHQTNEPPRKTNTENTKGVRAFKAVPYFK